MKVLFDHQIFSEQKYGGISRYFSEILKYGESDTEVLLELSTIFSNNYYLKKYFPNRSSFLPNLEFRGKRKLLSIINQYYSIYMLNKGFFDVFHPTYYNPYFIKYLNKKPYVITVHDLIYEIFKEDTINHNKIRAFMKKTIENATHIIAISKNTKKDILKFYSVPENKISVIYHGNKIINNSNIISNKYKKNKKFFLYIGKRGGYKNFTSLVYAIHNILIKENIFLICIGGGPQNANEIALLKRLNVERNVIFLPKIKDDELGFYYSNAISLIYPSKYEGFGLPILEAMSFGCPVLLSNSSVFPEIAGDAGLYFDPNKIYSISEAVNNILYSVALRDSLVKKGLARVKMFNWMDTYYKTKEVYRKII